MKRLINESEMTRHNTSSNVQEILHKTRAIKDDYPMIKGENVDEFNTVRLNDSQLNNQSECNSSIGYIKAKKRYYFILSLFTNIFYNICFIKFIIICKLLLKLIVLYKF